MPTPPEPRPNNMLLVLVCLASAALFCAPAMTLEAASTCERMKGEGGQHLTVVRAKEAPVELLASR